MPTAIEFPALTKDQPLTPEQKQSIVSWLEENRNPSFTSTLARLHEACQRKNGFRLSYAEGSALVEILPEFQPKPKAPPKPPKPRGQSAVEITDQPAETVELIPFSKLPGYLLDPWGIPHRQPGQGRAPGKVRPENVLFYRKGRAKVQHSARYSLTIDGQRQRFCPAYLLRARLHAEAEYRQQQREKLPLSNCKLPEVAPAQAQGNIGEVSHKYP